jgi:hypothetical protein
MYKQRHKPVNEKRTASKNYAHVKYIATRPGVMKNEANGHGLFGRISGIEQDEFPTWEEVAKKVYRVSKEGKNVYRPIISFKAETAAELGIKNNKDWQKYVEQNIATLAEKNGIKIQNMCYCAAAHYSRSHPHVHIVFWDKAQEVVKNFVHPEIVNSARKQLIKDTFAEQIKEYYEEKDKSYKSILSITDENITEYEEYVKSINPEEERAMAEWLGLDEAEDHEAAYLHILKDRAVLPLAAHLYELKEKMPRSGRMTFGFLPEELKGSVRNIAEELIDNSPHLKEEVDRYVESKMNLFGMYYAKESAEGEPPEKAEKRAEAWKHKEAGFHGEVVDIIAKRIVRVEAEIIKAEGRGVDFENNEDARNYYSESVLMDVFSFLVRLTRSHDAPGNKGHRNGDLSKAARIEKMLEAQDHGLGR